MMMLLMGENEITQTVRATSPRQSRRKRSDFDALVLMSSCTAGRRRKKGLCDLMCAFVQVFLCWGWLCS